MLCLILIALCLASLRAPAEDRWLRIYGISLLVFSGLLLFVRWYETGPRLVGYGMIAFLIGFRPVNRANWLWIALGAASLVSGVVNAATANSFGGNDPRYAAVAAQLRDYYRGKDTVATNSSLYIYADMNVAESFDPAEAARRFRKFLWVTLPQYDAIQAMVYPSPRPGEGWCEEKRFTGAILFARCNVADPAGH
jgi:hypothetical protein